VSGLRARANGRMGGSSAHILLHHLPSLTPWVLPIKRSTVGLRPPAGQGMCFQLGCLLAHIEAIRIVERGAMERPNLPAISALPEMACPRAAKNGF
jgi:hypothetical protein